MTADGFETAECPVCGETIRVPTLRGIPIVEGGVSCFSCGAKFEVVTDDDSEGNLVWWLEREMGQ